MKQPSKRESDPTAMAFVFWKPSRWTVAVSYS